jgi:hypothetical protein
MAAAACGLALDGGIEQLQSEFFFRVREGGSRESVRVDLTPSAKASHGASSSRVDGTKPSRP